VIIEADHEPLLKAYLEKTNLIITKRRIFNYDFNTELPDSYYYPKSLSEEENCNFWENFDNTFLLVAGLVLFIYVIWIFLLCLYCIKYRKIKSDYMILKDKDRGDCESVGASDNRIEQI
jgi:hypothetical protein